MTSDHHHSLSGAGNPHSSAPLSIPVYRRCEICGQADEAQFVVDGMCRDCVGVVVEAVREAIQNQERERKVARFDAITAIVVGLWAAVLVWRWWR